MVSCNRDFIICIGVGTINEIISAYDERIIRAYSWGRFKIINKRFLDEIGQYLPMSGQLLDLGCGYGLFSLYFAKKFPNLSILGLDNNPDRIAVARRAASNLSLSNVHYEVGDATSYEFPSCFDGVYMLDIVHHVPGNEVPTLLKQIYSRIKPGKRLIIKDIDTKPAFKLWFTYILDKFMDRRSKVHYWESNKFANLLRETGFEVSYHTMPDSLPFPHILYICIKK